MLVFVAEALASAFVVPHPDDYRALHQSLLMDFYGELMLRYGLLYPESVVAEAANVDERRIDTLEDLQREVDRMRREHAEFSALSGSGLLETAVRATNVYGLGPFTLQTFVSSLNPAEENHLGERIVRSDGTLEYLKTHRLSDAEVRRAYLLEQLARHSWNLQWTAEALHTTVADVVLRVERAGFGYLLNKQALGVRPG